MRWGLLPFWAKEAPVSVCGGFSAPTAPTSTNLNFIRNG
jgi:hypothetical protein